MATPQLDAFQVIADPSRRKIISLLSEEVLTINSLTEHFEMSRPAVSKHIKILELAGFIKIENQGRERYCHLHSVGFEAIKDWIAYYDDFWKEKINKLHKLIETNESE
ncbi:helix-turn-helix transcriptional regulator [Jiulongibacter sediminis]|jgi:DNA-binding transcriptional ArsR family regulator|uniref:ArsR/SmtB family transcription factor n=1 Tax=Jiulongibacter sediminis TaxID=1605367 RepID=UPI0026EC8A9E|nr:metalloregulator ArsR/SmtB family transcription factor [Jiulongibacter sediminis]